jgi:hypothetical protein
MISPNLNSNLNYLIPSLPAKEVQGSGSHDREGEAIPTEADYPIDREIEGRENGKRDQKSRDSNRGTEGGGGEG